MKGWRDYDDGLGTAPGSGWLMPIESMCIGMLPKDCNAWMQRLSQQTRPLEPIYRVVRDPAPHAHHNRGLSENICCPAPPATTGRKLSSSSVRDPATSTNDSGDTCGGD